MLDPDDVDLDELAEALDDHSADVSYGHSWWLDPTTAEIRFHSADVDDETADDLDEAGLIHVDALPSSVGYGDMEDFVEGVQRSAGPRPVAAGDRGPRRRSGASRTRSSSSPSFETTGSRSATSERAVMRSGGSRTEA